MLFRSADSTVQGLSARATMSMMREAFETDTESVMRRAALQNRNVHVDGYDKLDAVIRPYLPSHLSSTNTVFTSPTLISSDLFDGAVHAWSVSGVNSDHAEGEFRYLLKGATQKDLANLSRLGLRTSEYWSHVAPSTTSSEAIAPQLMMAVLDREIRENSGAALLVCRGNDAARAEMLNGRDGQDPWLSARPASGLGVEDLVLWRRFASLVEAIHGSREITDADPRIRPTIISRQPAAVSLFTV